VRVDHIGYAVKNIDKAKKSMEALGYTFKPTIEDTDRNIFIAFGSLDGYCIELVAPFFLGGGISNRLCAIQKWSDSLPHLLYKRRH